MSGATEFSTWVTESVNITWTPEPNDPTALLTARGKDHTLNKQELRALAHAATRAADSIGRHCDAMAGIRRDWMAVMTPAQRKFYQTAPWSDDCLTGSERAMARRLVDAGFMTESAGSVFRRNRSAS